MVDSPRAETGVLLMGGPWASPRRRLRALTVASSADFEAALVRAAELAEARQTSSKDFWDRVHVHDLRLVRELHDGTLNDGAKAVAQGYRRLQKRFGSQRELDSVRDHVGFLTRVIRGSRRKNLEHLRAQMPGLEDLYTRLGKG